MHVRLTSWTASAGKVSEGFGVVGTSAVSEESNPVWNSFHFKLIWAAKVMAAMAVVETD